MSEYTRWQQLNESLGFPLGVKSMSNLGITGLGLEEAKKKKKMNGDDVPPPPDEDEEEDDELDIDIKDDDDDDIEIGDKKPCKCDKPDFGDDDDDEDEGPGPGPMFCKNCKGMKSGQKKKKGKKRMKDKKCMKEEDIFASYRGTTFKENPDIGSDEYRQEFFKSLSDHFSDPNKKFDDGVDLGEEVLFEPRDEVAPLAQTPVPGSPGSSPYTRLGEDAPAKEPEKADWEKQFNKVPMAEDFIKDAGLEASFGDWLKKKNK